MREYAKERIEIIINEKMLNEELRERFHKYRDNEMNPSLTLIAKAIGIAYNYFAQWNKGTVDLSERKLVDIKSFLESKNY